MAIGVRPLSHSREDKAAKSAVPAGAYAVALLIMANGTVPFGHY